MKIYVKANEVPSLSNGTKFVSITPTRLTSNDIEALKYRAKSEGLFAICYRIVYPMQAAKLLNYPGRAVESKDGLFTADSYEDYRRQIDEIVNRTHNDEHEFRILSVYGDDISDLEYLQECIDDPDMSYPGTLGTRGRNYLMKWFKETYQDELADDIKSIYSDILNTNNVNFRRHALDAYVVWSDGSKSKNLSDPVFEEAEDRFKELVDATSSISVYRGDAIHTLSGLTVTLTRVGLKIYVRRFRQYEDTFNRDIRL